VEFTGRDSYLRLLSKDLADVALTGTGRFVVVKGRRRVGKSRLVEEFLERERPPSVFFAASRQRPERELELFSEAVAASSIPAASLIGRDGAFRSWDAALSLIAATTSTSEPAVIVVDEFPFLLEHEPAIEGTFQKLWDRELQSRPILLILIGSDLRTMEALGQYGKPLYGRPTRTLTVDPFSPTELADMLKLDAVEALDAYLALGGFPLIAQSWEEDHDLWGFLAKSLVDPTSPLIVDGERSLAAEFPTELQARSVLNAIGAGERTFSAIGRAAGLGQSSLQRSLELLVERKRVVSRATPLPARSQKERRYLVADPYLRFWLKFIGPHIEEIERGRGLSVLGRIREGWPTYRGTAIEAVVRAATERLLSGIGLPGGARVGSFWTRGNDIEVDVVVVEGSARRQRVAAAGSIKWRDNKPFDSRDRDRLVRQIPAIPAADSRTKTLAVSRSGYATTEIDIRLGPDELIEAWRADPLEGAIQ
jgi:hypothetical protein